MKARLPWIIILIFLAAYPLIIAGGSPYYIAMFTVFAIYVILAVSLDLVVGFTGLISLGHAAFFAIGAYTSAVLTTKYGVTPIWALLSGLIFTGFISTLIGFSVLSLKGYYLAMATLGLSAITYTLIIGLESITGGASGLRDVPPFSLFGISLGDYTAYYYLVWAAALLVLLSCLAVVKSPLGKTLIAIHSDEGAAETLGVNAARYKISIFVLSAVFASLAGSLYAHYISFLAPDDFSMFTSIHILIMVFLGGAGTIWGPAIGAVFLKLLPEITHAFQDYELLGNGIILILVLVFMPKGLWGMFLSISKKIGMLSRDSSAAQ